jgi:hypothetical protein
MENFRIYKIHVSYIIGFLIIVIIGMMTVKWSNIPNLVDYITFALTLSSLILSMLAIIYSFVSNNKFSESIGALNNVSDDVLESSKKLNLITDDLSKKVEEIPIHLKNVEEKTEKTHSLLETMKFDMGNINNVEGQEPEEVTETLFSISNYLNTSSFNGKSLLYAINISYNQKKSFLLTELFPRNYEYMHGYFIASSAMGLFDYTETKDVFLITVLNDTISENIKEFAFNAAKKYDDGLKPEELEKFSWVNKLNGIDKYFNEKF